MSQAGTALKWRANGARSVGRSLWRTARWNRVQRVPVTFPDADRVPVIFCTWRRLERLPGTLSMLAAQDVPVQALIWNNSSDRSAVDKAVADAQIPAAAYHSPRNIGGFGRFYLAREAAESGHKAVVFVDDDQDFGPETIGELLRAHRPKSVSAWFAFTQATPSLQSWASPGEQVVYAGTCGMIADSALFTDTRLFGCPRRYWFLEDLWLSWFARKSGFEVFRSPAQFVENLDGLNQSLSLGWTRSRLVRYLERKNWQAS